jgi:hypothetical protein
MKQRHIGLRSTHQLIDYAAWHEHLAARTQPSAILTQQVLASQVTSVAPESRAPILDLDRWRARLASLTRRAA